MPALVVRLEVVERVRRTYSYVLGTAPRQRMYCRVRSRRTVYGSFVEKKIGADPDGIWSRLPPPSTSVRLGEKKPAEESEER